MGSFDAQWPSPELSPFSSPIDLGTAQRGLTPAATPRAAPSDAASARDIAPTPSTSRGLNTFPAEVGVGLSPFSAPIDLGAAQRGLNPATLRAAPSDAARNLDIALPPPANSGSPSRFRPRHAQRRLRRPPSRRQRRPSPSPGLHRRELGNADLRRCHDPERFSDPAGKTHGRRLIWLDNGATTQKPQAVIDRLAAFYAHENSNVHRAAHTLAARATDAYEAARDKVRRFVAGRRRPTRSCSCAVRRKESTWSHRRGAAAT